MLESREGHLSCLWPLVKLSPEPVFWCLPMMTTTCRFSLKSLNIPWPCSGSPPPPKAIFRMLWISHKSVISKVSVMLTKGCINVFFNKTGIVYFWIQCILQCSKEVYLAKIGYLVVELSTGGGWGYNGAPWMVCCYLFDCLFKKTCLRRGHFRGSTLLYLHVVKHKVVIQLPNNLTVTYALIGII